MSFYEILCSRIGPAYFAYSDYIRPLDDETHLNLFEAFDYWGQFRELDCYWVAEEMVSISSALGWKNFWRPMPKAVNWFVQEVE